MATAVVAGLIALVGVLACRWLLDIPVLAPRQDGAYGDASTTALVLVAVVAALAATALEHLLLLTTPRPFSFFGWILALVTALAILLLFQTGAPLKPKVATAVLYLVIAIAIGSLVSSVGRRATRSQTYPEEAWPDR